MATKKAGQHLLLLAGLAVGAIYTGAYWYTDGASTGSATLSAPGTAGSTGQPAQSASSKATATPHHTAAARWRDGVYFGAGSNPYGTLSVVLKIAGGKIASVRLTQYAMHYPPSFIVPTLPQEVVSMQTWRIYVVSGATASSYNFAEAVYYALQKARA